MGESVIVEVLAGDPSTTAIFTKLNESFKPPHGHASKERVTVISAASVAYGGGEKGAPNCYVYEVDPAAAGLPELIQIAEEVRLTAA